MKIYTKTGDRGTTGLLTGQRVEKDSLRVEAYGAIDEITSALGMARAAVLKNDVRDTIFKLQKLLSCAMADIASIDSGNNYVTAEHIKLLEQTIDSYNEKLPPLTHFIVPGDTLGSAALDLARTVTRRAERSLWRLSRTEKFNESVLVLLNRLSDLCFVLARVESELKG